MSLSPRVDTGIQSSDTGRPLLPPATGNPSAAVRVGGVRCCLGGGRPAGGLPWARDPRGGGHGAKVRAPGDPASAALLGTGPHAVGCCGEPLLRGHAGTAGPGLEADQVQPRGGASGLTPLTSAGPAPASGSTRV